MFQLLTLTDLQAKNQGYTGGYQTARRRVNRKGHDHAYCAG